MIVHVVGLLGGLLAFLITGRVLRDAPREVAVHDPAAWQPRGFDARKAAVGGLLLAAFAYGGSVALAHVIGPLWAAIILAVVLTLANVALFVLLRLGARR